MKYVFLFVALFISVVWFVGDKSLITYDAIGSLALAIFMSLVLCAKEDVPRRSK